VAKKGSKFQGFVDSQIRKAERQAKRTGNWSKHERLTGKSQPQQQAATQTMQQPGGELRGFGHFGGPPATWPGQMDTLLPKSKEFEWMPIGETNPRLSSFYLNISQQARKPYQQSVRFMAEQDYTRRITENLGYEPSYFEDPSRVAAMYHAFQGAGKDAEVPEWLNTDALGQAYQYFKFRNEGVPWSEWKYLPPDDPGRQFLRSIGTPPVEFMRPQDAATFANPDAVKSGGMAWSSLAPEVRAEMLSDPSFYEGQILEFPMMAQQEILADPSFDWSQLPEWQSKYFGVSSSPAKMGAIQGGVMGMMFGGPAGIIGGGAVGGLMGYAAGKYGFDPTMEFWEQDALASKVLGLMMWFGERTEMLVGVPIQAIGTFADPKQELQDLLEDPETTWLAGGGTYEEIGPLIADVPNMYLEAIELTETKGMAFNSACAEVLNRRADGPLEFYLGSREKLPTGRGNMFEALATARERIAAGENYRQVMFEAQMGVAAQLSDLALQGFADPLNFVPEISAGAVRLGAKATGHKTAAAAFTGVRSPIEGIRKYATKVQTGDVAPGFKYNEMTGLQRMMGGITLDQAGDPVLKAGKFTSEGMFAKPEEGFKNYLGTLTPESRARVGLGLANDNVLALMSMFDDPSDVVQLWTSIKNGDMQMASEMGARFVNAPEFYTILPALKGYDMSKMLGIWEASRNSANVVERVAAMLGETPYNILDDIATPDGARRIFERMKTVAGESAEPRARAILDDVQAGRLDADELVQAGKIFNGEAAAPLDFRQWKAMVADNMTTHFAEWARDFFGLQPDSMFFRAAHTMKRAQSLLLLGLNPNYAINNGLNNMVTRAATGNFGFMTPKQIDTFMARLDLEPYRMREGVGAMGDTTIGRTGAAERVLSGATKQKGILNDADRVLRSAQNKIGLFSKLSHKIEQIESANAFAVGIKRMWPHVWKRGRGFRRMDLALEQAVNNTYPGASDIIYQAIEAGMNQAEIENAIMKGQKTLRSRSFVDTVANELGTDPAQATAMLDQIGVLDRLDNYLDGVKTDDQVRRAFKSVMKQAQDHIDLQLARDFANQAEHITNRIKHEGMQAVSDVIIDGELAIQERWLEHYSDFGDVFEHIENVEDPLTQQNLIEDTYMRQNREWRRVNRTELAIWKGLADGLGFDDARVRKFLADKALVHNLWNEAYQFRLDETARYTDQWRNDWTAPGRYADREALSARISEKFADTFKKVQRAEKRMGDVFAEKFEPYGPEAVKMARKHWRDVMKFREKMWNEMQAHRESLKNLSYDDRRRANYLFWQERYPELIRELQAMKMNSASELNRRMRGGGEDLAPPSEIGPRPPDEGQPGGGGAEAEAPPEIDLDAELAAEAEAEAAGLETVFEIAVEHDLPKLRRDDGGVLIKDFGADLAILAIVRKFGGEEGANVRTFQELADVPDLVAQAFENRAAAEESKAGGLAGDAFKAAEEARATSIVEGAKVGPNTRILRAIQEHGGLRLGLRRDLTGDPKFKKNRGVFKRGGMDLDDMVVRLVEDGFPIDVNDPVDPGGTIQAGDLIRRAIDGEEIYPVGHDYEAAIVRQEIEAAKAAESAYNETIARSFDAEQWIQSVREIEDSLRGLDLNDPFADEQINYIGLTSLMDDLPNQIADTVYGPTGETYRDYVIRVFGEAQESSNQIRELRDVATKLAEIDAETEAVRQFEDMVMTKELFREQLSDVFDLSDMEADAVVQITDARAKAWAETMNMDPSEWYSKNIAGLVRGGDGLEQAQVKTGLPPRGAIDFLDDGRAIIRSLEQSDVSTAVHELAHVFRRELTGEDLQVIEEWAGVKDGSWNEAQEDQFSYAFERYLWEGKAPSTALADVFYKFKTWLLNIYKEITGSPIDVNLTDEVRLVFDKLLGLEELEKFGVEIDHEKVAAIKKDYLADVDLDVIKRQAQLFRQQRRDLGETRPKEVQQLLPFKEIEPVEPKTETGQAEFKVDPEKVAQIRKEYLADVDLDAIKRKAAEIRGRESFPQEKGPVQKPEPVPPDMWESTITKARVYAKDLLDIGRIMPEEVDPIWNDLDALVELIKSKPKHIDRIDFSEGVHAEIYQMEDGRYGLRGADTDTGRSVDVRIYNTLEEAQAALDRQRPPQETPPPVGVRELEGPPDVGGVLASETPGVGVFREKSLMYSLADRIRHGDWFEKPRDFEEFARESGFDLESEADLNMAYDLMEGAYSIRAREIRADLANRGAGILDHLTALDELESNLTTARRTISKMKAQQFSTPLTISEAAAHVADVRPGDVIGEPTAGTGNLIDMFAGRQDIEIRVNEFDTGRRQVLEILGYEPTGMDLMTSDWVIQDGVKAGAWADVVISNPPWGSYNTGKYGKALNTPVKLNDWSQRFTYLTMMRMPDDGRFVGVMPINWLYTKSRKTKAITYKPSAFYTWLRKNYTVQAVIESPPGAYKQRATDVGSLLVVVDKTPQVLEKPVMTHYGKDAPNTWKEYADLVESVPKRTKEAVDHAQAESKPVVAGPEQSGLFEPSTTKPTVERTGQPPEDVSQRTTDTGRPARDSGEPDVGVSPAGDVVDVIQPARAAGDTGPRMVEPESAKVSRPAKRRTYSDNFQDRLVQGRKAVRDSRSFTELVARTPLRVDEQAHPHPNIIVETKSLAGIKAQT